MKNEKILNDPDFIKKSILTYPSCQQQGLHEGEKLSLVCIDSNCKSKGLVCPVCKQDLHKEHTTMHIKHFLSQLLSSMPENSLSGTNLSQNLNKLELARKNLKASLNESIANLAKTVKQIQMKIEQNYLKIRKIILSQKSSQSKLPKIFQMLLEGQEEKYRNFQIQEQVQKCAVLMQSKSNKNSCVIENSEKIVEEYIKQSQNCTTHLMDLISGISDRVKELPISLKSLSGLENKKQSKIMENTKYSSTLKSKKIVVDESGKEITEIESEDSYICFALIDEEKEKNEKKNTGIRKIALRIKKSVSQSICMGVCVPEVIQNSNFESAGLEIEGIFGICSMGIALPDIDDLSFVFSQSDILDLQLNEQQKKLTITRRNSVQSKQIPLDFSLEEIHNLKFFVTLSSSGDCVSLVK